MAREAFRYLGAFARHGFAALSRRAATLADLLARHARLRPDALAVEVAGQRLSYSELEAASHGAVRVLLELGARSGDVVALLGKNSLGYVAALLGGARAGITLALVHPELRGEPLQQALVAANARFVLCERELASDARQAAAARPVATFDPTSAQPFAPATAVAAFDPERRARDFALVFTSGTTGMPKACRLPHSRVLAAAYLFGVPLYDFRAGDKLLCALPLHHGSPLMLGLAVCLVTGTPLALERQFSAREFWPRAVETEATALLYVGDLGRMLLATPPAPSDRAHRVRVAVGNGMAADVWQAFQDRFGIASVREFYAATESPVGILNLAGRVGAVGNLPYAWMFGLKLARLDADGELARDARGRLVECAVDEPGELLVRARKSGVGVYHGYVDANATEARLVRDAFVPGDALFRTFDVLRRDRDGFYYFVERGGDSYRFRGENVSPQQVERELLRLAGVRDAVVTGVALPGYDGRVGLAVVVGDADFDVARLSELEARLPRSSVPRFVRAVPELLRTNSLKLLRRQWALAGVDPERVAGPLWVQLAGHYRPLTSELYRDIACGKARL